MKNVICGRCVKCGREYEATPDLTNCACGGILDIVYDYDYIKKNLPSVLRNELIAKTLYVGKRIEEFGSGLKRVNALCRDAGIRYSFENSELGFRAVIYRSQPIDVTLNVPINVTLNGTEMSILALLKTNPDMTRDELAERVSKTVRTVQRSIDSLKKKGIIERSGSKKTGSWIFKK